PGAGLVTAWLSPARHACATRYEVRPPTRLARPAADSRAWAGDRGQADGQGAEAEPAAPQAGRGGARPRPAPGGDRPGAALHPAGRTPPARRSAAAKPPTATQDRSLSRLSCRVTPAPVRPRRAADAMPALSGQAPAGQFRPAPAGAPHRRGV